MRLNSFASDQDFPLSLYDPVKTGDASGMVDSTFKEKKLHEAYDMVQGRKRLQSDSIDQPRAYQDVLSEEIKVHNQLKHFQTGIEQA